MSFNSHLSSNGLNSIDPQCSVPRLYHGYSRVGLAQPSVLSEQNHLLALSSTAINSGNCPVGLGEICAFTIIEFLQRFH